LRRMIGLTISWKMIHAFSSGSQKRGRAYKPERQSGLRNWIPSQVRSVAEPSAEADLGGLAMNEPAASVTIALRIPGQWANPQELIQRLPAGCRLTAETLVLPDGTQVEFGAAAADAQF